MALAAVRMTSSTVTPRRLSRCGSMRTCSCRSRNPQMDTLDTPGTLSRRCRTFQRASTERSMRESSFDDRPISMRRPVVAVGWITNGGFDTWGSAGTMVSRSCTTCRARTGSVPGSKIISIADTPGAESERSLASQGIPLKNSFSIGLVIRFSTSSGDSPSASVCTSTRTGPKSGRTSSVASRSWTVPAARRPAATTMISMRKCALDPMIHRSMAYPSRSNLQR